MEREKMNLLCGYDDACHDDALPCGTTGGIISLINTHADNSRSEFIVTFLNVGLSKWMLGLFTLNQWHE